VAVKTVSIFALLLKFGDVCTLGMNRHYPQTVL